MKEAKTKLYGIRGTRSKKKFGSSSIYDYDFGEGGLQQWFKYYMIVHISLIVIR